MTLVFISFTRRKGIILRRLSGTRVKTKSVSNLVGGGEERVFRPRVHFATDFRTQEKFQGPTVSAFLDLK